MATFNTNFNNNSNRAEKKEDIFASLFEKLHSTPSTNISFESISPLNIPSVGYTFHVPPSTGWANAPVRVTFRDFDTNDNAVTVNIPRETVAKAVGHFCAEWFISQKQANTVKFKAEKDRISKQRIAAEEQDSQEDSIGVESDQEF